MTFPVLTCKNPQDLHILLVGLPSWSQVGILKGNRENGVVRMVDLLTMDNRGGRKLTGNGYSRWIPWNSWNHNSTLIHKFKTKSVLYPPRDNPYGIHGMGGGLQKFQMESMEWGMDSILFPWNGGWIP